MNKLITSFVAAGALAFASASFAIPLYIDVAGAGGTGESFAVPLGDADTLTDLFDTMSFTTTSADLTAVTSDSIHLFSLAGVDLFTVGGFAATEGIGYTGPGSDPNSSLIADWTPGIAGASFTLYLDDDNIAPSVVASGTVTSISATNLSASIDTMLAGFWFNSANVDMSTIVNATDTLDLQMSVQSGGRTVDISQVPEPSIIALFGLGLAGLGFSARRRKAK